MKAEAIAELDAEDGFHVDHHDRFSRTPAKDFYKKPVLCVAHVVGIADPYYSKLEDWNVRDERERQRPATSMVRKGWNGQELKKDKLKDEIQAGEGVMDRAAAQLILTRTQTVMTTNACDVEYFLEHMDRRVGGECSDLETPAESLYNAQGKLAFELGFVRTVQHVLSGTQRTPRSTSVALQWHAPKWCGNIKITSACDVALNYFVGRRHWGGAPTAHHQRHLLMNRGVRTLVCNLRRLGLRSYTALRMRCGRRRLRRSRSGMKNRQSRSLSRLPPRSAFMTNSKGTLMNALLAVTGSPALKGRP